MRRGLLRSAASVALLAAAIALPYVASAYTVTLATLVLISALLAASVNMLAGDAGLVSLGHAGIAAAAGYGLAWSVKHGMDLWAQIVIAVGMTVLVSVLFGLIAMRTSGVFFLMVTLAAGMVCYGIAYRWSAVTGGDNGLTGIRRPESITHYWQFYFFVLTVLILALLVMSAISRSPFGLVLRGIRDSETRMTSLGYSVPARKLAAMVLSGIFAGLAGMLLVWQSEFISPSIGDFHSSALLLIMVVLGGIGTTIGPLLGAAVVVVVQQVVSSYLDRWTTLLGLLFIASVIFAPQGLAGALGALARRAHPRATASRRSR